MPRPDSSPTVIDTMREYFRHLMAAGREQWVAHWCDVERGLTLGDPRMSVTEKELWLAVVDQMEEEFLPTPRADSVSVPREMGNRCVLGVPAKIDLFGGEPLSEEEVNRLFAQVKTLIEQRSRSLPGPAKD